MPQNHYMPLGVAGWEPTRMSLSINPTGHALIFVHGYSGHALESWVEFPRILETVPAFSGYDIYFYGYSSVRPQVWPNAVDLLGFLEFICSPPDGFFRRVNGDPLARDRGFTYQSIVIVAHSMGAVLARLALLRAHETSAPWLQKVQLALYAPAHIGSYVTHIARDGMLQRVLPLIYMLIAFRSPPIEDLQPNSVLLTNLKDNTVTAIQTGNASYLKPRLVVWARYDNIVINQPFPGDPTPVVFDTDHKGVCKPSKQFTAPKDRLQEAIV